MEIRLQQGLEHQQLPIEALTRVFEEVETEEPNSYYENPTIDLTDVHTAKNIMSIQADEKMNVEEKHRKYTAPEDGKPFTLDIKMETGTGKTYVYTHAIYELHRQYGINKFLIVVPTLPIKAGTAQFIGDSFVQNHFKEDCGYGASIKLGIVTEGKQKKGRKFYPSSVREFVQGSNQNRNEIYVLLLNSQLLTNAKVLTRDDYDQELGVTGAVSPIEAIRATKPFVIIDEPHRFSKDQKTYTAIAEKIQPQCLIRFGATFPEITEGKGKNKTTRKDYENLLYNLNACRSFNRNLIKGVAKEHFEPVSRKDAKVKITSIGRGEANFAYITREGSTTYKLENGDTLSRIDEAFAGLNISRIGAKAVEFSNGLEKRAGEEFDVDACAPSYQEAMLKLAIQRHFETERKNFNRSPKIKTLALFFIDSIESYRGDKEGNGAWLAEKFDDLLTEAIDKELSDERNPEDYKSFLQASKEDPAACRGGYFAQDNNDSDENIAKEIDDILHNKKELLAFKDSEGKWKTRRFLFSKWTLKEGWDNPNVFTIAKLRSSGSETSKLQEVGRGLRLPVDELGNRISNEDFTLNYIVDFTERDFADKLIAEINGESDNVAVTAITSEELKRVAELSGKKDMELMMELYQKQYITDTDRTLNTSKLSEFYAEYPAFNQGGVNSGKIGDRNKKQSNKIKIRKAQFEELKGLWMKINRKYVIFFNQETDRKIEEALPRLLDGAFGYQTIRSDRETINVDENKASIAGESGVEYMMKSKVLPYNEFLKRLNKATSISISSLHKAICTYARRKEFDKDYINEASLSRIASKFNVWKTENLLGNISYKQTDYNSKSTKLTDGNGNVLDEVSQTDIGVMVDDEMNVSSKYLYEKAAYDSELEKTDLETDVDNVVVYGKIPRRSIAIPTVLDNYSPDFMYVVRRKDGRKELNVVIEVKGVDDKGNLRPEENTRIACAKRFFEQLQADGLDVRFETQINNKGVTEIVQEMIIRG